MRKVIKWVVIAILVIFLGMQVYQPERTNPPVDETKTLFAVVTTPPEIRTVFERSCFDCHSHNTRWPFYSSIAPASWLVAADVHEGRKHLNLSMWGDYNTNKRVAKLDQICQEISDEKMPLKQYLLLHSSAALSKAEVDLICDWADEQREKLMASDTTESPAQK